jgi:general secretion pathway protein F
LVAFYYAALDNTGKRRKGTVEADNSKQARQQIRDLGLAPLEVRATITSETDQKGTLATSIRLTVNDLSLLTRQMATLIQAGLPIADALAAVSRQTEKHKVAAMVASLRNRVVEGHSLAYALAEFPRVFSPLYRATVAAGEQSGYLGRVMSRLADHTEATTAARQRVRLAMLYPAILTVVAILIVSGLMAYVVPDVIEVFINQGQALPLLTRLLISISNFVVSYGLLALALVIGLLSGFRWRMKNDDFRRRWHRRKLRIPVFRRLVRAINTLHFSSTLSILVGSGIPLVEGLMIAGKVLPNDYFREGVEESIREVREGSSLSAALERNGQFPPMMIHMIASGEASGKLEDMLDRVAASQQRELDNLVSTLIGVFEPAMLLIMGGIVLGIVVAILQPLFSLNQLI